MATTASLAAWPDSVDALREILHIGSDPKMRCHGLTKKINNKEPRGCTREVGKGSWAQVCNLLAQIAKKGSLLAAKSLLQELALYAHCARDHRKNPEQTEKLFQKWVTTLSHLKVEVKEEPGSNATERTLVGSIRRVKLEAPSIDAFVLSAVPAAVGGSVIEKHGTRSDMHIKLEGDTAMDTTADFTSESEVSKPPKGKPRASKTKAAAKRAAEKKGEPKHVFERYKPVKTTLEMNKTIKKLIERNLLATEKPKPKDPEGYVYMYTFPEEYRAASPYIKIGHTKERDNRMSSWARKCGYQPKVLGHFRAELYVKVEKLVHRQLANERRVESKGCPVCQVKHHEWFEVKFYKAAAAVGLWIDWARREPYDENGILKVEWKKRLDSMSLESKDCWESFVNDPFDDEENLGHSESESASEAEDSDSESFNDSDEEEEEELGDDHD